MKVHPMAGQPPPSPLLVDVPRPVTAYYTERPDPSIRVQRVAFGTSGHRGSSLDVGFNEGHILAITQAICSYRREQGIDGPIFLGWDTHALSEPARVTALEVLGKEMRSASSCRTRCSTSCCASRDCSSSLTAPRPYEQCGGS